jgi:tetratricopeptide (TPR) repeat protein
MSHQRVRLTMASVLLATGIAFGQPAMPVPQPSPKAMISQTVGLTEVVVSYHRPAVRNRPVWGGLVPFNEVWRAGANENTTISFNDPVKIEGKDLPAGTYGLHMIPTEKAWTIIFNKNATSWGSFFYDPSEDALRVEVQPQSAEHQEQLSYEFNNVTPNSAVIALRWEKLSIPIKLEVDTKAIVVANAKKAYLRGPAGFTWQGFNQAAAYCLQSSVNLDEALMWSDRSIAINENVTNLFVKSGILRKLGKDKDADALAERMVKVAVSEADVNLLGYQYLGAGKTKEAIDVFKKNVKQHPDSWNTYDSLAEGYEKSGNTKLAIENYSKALNMVKDAANQKRIADTVKHLQGK